MNASAVNDLLEKACEVQSLTNDMSLQLKHIASGSAGPNRRELRLLAAAAELVSDRVLLIIESARSDQ